jgi:hypothetical protein
MNAASCFSFPENGVVEFNFSDLSVFNGLATVACSSYDYSTLTTNTDVIRIS